MIQIFSIVAECIFPNLNAFLDSAASFVYNYKPASFKEDFISALTALVTAQDDPWRLRELTERTKSILNEYQKELPIVLKQVKLKVFLHALTIFLHIQVYML